MNKDGEKIIKYFDLYSKAINQIDDYFEYDLSGKRTYDDARTRVYAIIDKLTLELSKVKDERTI